MIRVTMKELVIEIPDEVGVAQGLFGALPVADKYQAGPEREAEPEPAADDLAEARAKAEADKKAKAEADKKAKAEADKKAKAEAAKAKADAEAAKAQADAAKAALEEDESGVTKEQVKAALSEAAEKGVDIIAILGKYGANKVSALDPSRYAEIMEDLK